MNVLMYEHQGFNVLSMARNDEDLFKVTFDTCLYRLPPVAAGYESESGSIITIYVRSDVKFSANVELLITFVGSVSDFFGALGCSNSVNQQIGKYIPAPVGIIDDTFKVLTDQSKVKVQFNKFNVFKFILLYILNNSQYLNSVFNPSSCLVVKLNNLNSISNIYEFFKKYIRIKILFDVYKPIVC